MTRVKQLVELRRSDNDKPELPMDPAVGHSGLIRPFLSRQARARFDEIEPGTSRRTRLLNRLCHDFESTLDWRTAKPIATTDQTPELIAPLLRKLGAGNACYVLCCSEEWDGKHLPLLDALRALVGNGLPVLLVCIPSSLAYFEPEYVAGAGQRFVLQRSRR